MGQIQAVSNIFRPQGSKVIVLGQAWNKGSQVPINNSVDLSVPVVAMRFVISGRLTVGTAAYTSVTPEQLLNLLTELKIYGQNTRQKGNTTMFDLDLASWLGFKSLIARRAYHYFVSKAGGALTVNPVPSTPYVGGGFDGTTNAFDFRIVFDVPFYPEQSGDAFVPGWALRSSEWNNTVQILLTFAKLTDNATNEIGVSAATTTTTLTAFGSGAGNPTVDVYSIPNIAGQQNDANILPGVLSRTSSIITASLVNGSNLPLIQQLQKQNTSRIFLKVGTGTISTSFATLSDTIITQLGVTVGGNRAVRNLVDVFAHKLDWSHEYDTDPIQGYSAFDFLQSDNPFSAYPGMNVGGGSTFSLVGTVAAVGNNQGIAVQEQQIFQPSGALYAQ